MEITDSAIIALFSGLVFTLIRVVEFFISKYKKDKPKDIISDLTKNIENQEEISKKILEHTKHLDEMHSVYNDHIPAWYVPSDMLELIRENNNSLNILLKYIYSMEDDQRTIINKMLELINSQKLMTDRVGDLINALNKFSR